MPEDQTPGRPDDATVIAELHCRGCGYDLRGLSTAGRCPECGLEIWETIAGTVDPTSSRLPRLGNPSAVGNGLVLLMLCFLLALVVMSLGPVLSGFVRSGSVLRWQYGPIVLPRDCSLLSSLIGMLALWSTVRLWPARESARDRRLNRDLWMLVSGIVIWIIAMGTLWLVRMQWDGPFNPTDRPYAGVAADILVLATGGAALAALSGLRGMLREIGLRSRVYRRAKGGRQQIQPMLAAIAGVMVGLIVRQIGLFVEVLAILQGFGEVLIAVSLLMLLIGQVYLLINAWWIRSALRRPPPLLDQLIAAAPPTGPGPADGSSDPRP